MLQLIVYLCLIKKLNFVYICDVLSTTRDSRQFMSLFFFQAKQRASIKWLLSKAYDHRTPEELKEPFYKNHDVSHLQSPTDFDLKL